MNDIKKQRHKNHELWKELGQSYDFEVNSNCDIKSFVESDQVKTAGRIMFLRPLGKIMFLKIRDFHGMCQISLQTKEFENLKVIKSALDLGDIIGVEGIIYKTVAGEKTIKVQKLTLLQKSLQPLPDKWSGLKNEEIKIQKRYLDLIVNEDLRNTFKMRFDFLKNLRKFLFNKGFEEVETPILNSIASGAAANPFSTYYDANKEQQYLRIAPELMLKRLITAGMNKVFEIAKCFRNEGIDSTHLPEFTMMEFYQSYISYEELQNLAIEMLQFLVKSIDDSLIVHELNFKEIPKISYVDLLKTYGDMDFEKLDSVDYLEEKAKEINLNLNLYKSHQAKVDALYKHCCLKKIQSPVLVFDYPRSPLAKEKDSDNRFSDQFQIILAGQEIIKSCLEMNNAQKQLENFNSQIEIQKTGDNDIVRNDLDFIDVLEIGMPPCGGLGFGIDRFLNIITNSKNIRNVILFPQRKLV